MDILFFSPYPQTNSSDREKALNLGLKYCPVLMGYKMKIIKTVLDRMFLSISWLKWFIVAYSIITLNVFFNKEQMCPCLALFLFVWFLIQKWITTLADPPMERDRERWGLSNGLGYQLGRLCCRKLETKHANLQAEIAQSRKTPKIKIYLPAIAVWLLWQSKKWVLAFFQTDSSNVPDRTWKWRVADPKTLNKVAPPWTLIYSLLLQRELKKSKSLRCVLNFFVSCPIHIWWGSWNLNTNPISKSQGHFKQ